MKNAHAGERARVGVSLARPRPSGLRPVWLPGPGRSTRRSTDAAPVRVSDVAAADRKPQRSVSRRRSPRGFLEPRPEGRVWNRPSPGSALERAPTLPPGIAELQNCRIAESGNGTNAAIARAHARSCKLSKRSRAIGGSHLEELHEAPYSPIHVRWQCPTTAHSRQLPREQPPFAR
jgi:hypothetical protein